MYHLICLLYYKEKKRLERMALEHQLNEDQRQQAVLAAEASSNKKHLMQFVAQVRKVPDPILVSSHLCLLHDYVSWQKIINAYHL